MQNLRHVTPAFATYHGPDALGALPRELERAGVRRAVLFCGPSIAARDDLLARLRQVLGSRLAGCFAGVREHSPLPAVEQGVAALREAGADGVIAVGGGSAVVSARAAAILLAEGRGARELCTHRGADGRLVSPRLDAPKLPQWVVATTPTTAYAKAGSAILDPTDGTRLALFDPKTRARALFVDPAFAASAPVPLAMAASLNALASAAEALESPTDDPLAQALLAESIALFAQWLPRLADRPDDPEVRGRLMLAALLAGQGTDFQGGGLVSALGHCVGARAGIANGIVNAIVLPHAMRFNAPATSGRSLRIAHALAVPAVPREEREAPPPPAGFELGSSTSRPGSPARREPIERAIGAVEFFLDSLAVPRRLRDAGVPQEVLAASVEHVRDDWFLSRNPRKVSGEDVMEVLRAAW